MSTAAAAVEEAPAPKKGKKKLIIIAVAALVLAGVGGTAVVLLKKKAVDTEVEADTEADGHAPAKAAAHHDPKNIPVFVPLDPFTVNLADREAERYAQVAITLELADAKAGDLLKAYMPAIRNNVLMVLAGKTAGQLMDRDGKLQLALEIRAAALKPLGFEIAVAARAASGVAAKPAPEDDDVPPIRAVHFANFIIQ